MQINGLRLLAKLGSALLQNNDLIRRLSQKSSINSVIDHTNYYWVYGY
jgi:hypothetical protein